MTDLDPYVLEQLQDVTASTAFQVLATLVDMGQVAPDKAELAQARFQQLSHEVSHSLARRTQLTAEAAELEQSLQEGKRQLAEIEADQAPYAGLTVAGQQADAASAWAEAQLAEQRHQQVLSELEDVQAQRDRLAERLDDIAEAHATTLEPIVAALQQELALLQDAAQQERQRAAGALQELKECRQRLEQAQSELSAAQAALQEQKLALARAEAAPDKARRAADLAAADVKLAERQVAEAGRQVAQVEAAVKAAEARAAALQAEHAQLQQSGEAMHNFIATKEGSEQEVLRSMELTQLEHERVLAARVDLDMREQALKAELQAQQSALGRAQLDKQRGLKAYLEAERALRDVRASLPSLEATREQLEREIAVMQSQVGQQSALVATLRQEVDARIRGFLGSEAVGKEVVALFELTAAELVVLEEQVVGLQAEGRQRLRAVAAASEQRDRACRLVGSKQRKVDEARQMAALRAGEARDLQRVLSEVAARGRDLSALHDLVRNQRNKLVHLINAARQGAAEMCDKVKVLEAERDILRAQADRKAGLLKQAKGRHGADVRERDALQHELQQLRSKCQQQETAVLEGAQQVEQLNGVVNRIESEMLAMRRQYREAIEARNSTGIMLIDRNDELCVLYERQSLQEGVMVRGTQELAAREDELRMLRLHVAELERSIAVVRNMAPAEEVADEKIAHALQELLEARREAAALEAALEDPDNTERFRQLEGRVPSSEELSVKAADLQQRLEQKGQQLQQRQLLLAEVTALAMQLAAQAGESYPAKLASAEQLCAAQAKLKGVTRKIMALVSELSMYQATAMKLASERQELQQLAEQAATRAAAGQPPTDDADMEWQRHQQQSTTLQELQHQRDQVKQLLGKQQQQQQQQPASTAEPRPNAYIPDSLGIPKPYGAFAPFKPSEQGSTMRHTRRPQPKEVVI